MGDFGGEGEERAVEAEAEGEVEEVGWEVIYIFVEEFAKGEVKN